MCWTVNATEIYEYEQKHGPFYHNKNFENTLKGYGHPLVKLYFLFLLFTML